MAVLADFDAVYDQFLDGPDGVFFRQLSGVVLFYCQTTPVQIYTNIHEGFVHRPPFFKQKQSYYRKDFGQSPQLRKCEIKVVGNIEF